MNIGAQHIHTSSEGAVQGAQSCTRPFTCYASAALAYSHLVAGHLLGPAGVSLLGRVTLLRVLRVVGLALALRWVLRVLRVLGWGALLLVLRWGTPLHEHSPIADPVRVTMRHLG